MHCCLLLKMTEIPTLDEAVCLVVGRLQRVTFEVEMSVSPNFGTSVNLLYKDCTVVTFFLL